MVADHTQTAQQAKKSHWKSAYKRPLRSMSEFATFISSLTPDEDRRLYRIFKVFHPVLEAQLGITVEEVSESYHILEKFMDILVCGGQTCPQDAPRISSKDELLQLLGVDHEAYEIAALYFDDLVINGHFRVEEDGIYPCKSAFDSVQTIDMDALFHSSHSDVEVLEDDTFGVDREQQESVKLERKYTQQHVYAKKLFDQYTNQLMPGCFYGADGYLSTPEIARGESEKGENAVWLPPVDTVLDPAVDLALSINEVNNQQGKTHYDSGLPQGFAGMQLISGSTPVLCYCPYYLVVYREKNNGFYYVAHDVVFGEQIPWMSENYNCPPNDDYRAATQTIRQLCDVPESKSVKSPVFENWPVMLKGKLTGMFGYSETEDGNLQWTMQPWQLPVLIQMCHNEDKRSKVKRALYNSCAVLNRYLAGRVVQIHIDDASRELLKEELQKPCPEKTSPIELEMDGLRVKLVEDKQADKNEDKQADKKALLKICDQCPEACFWLGYFDREEERFEQALGYFIRAANNGYVPALAYVAVTMEHVSNKPEGMKTAEQYLQMARDAGFDYTELVAGYR